MVSPRWDYCLLLGALQVVEKCNVLLASRGSESTKNKICRNKNSFVQGEDHNSGEGVEKDLQYPGEALVAKPIRVFIRLNKGNSNRKIMFSGHLKMTAS